MHAGIGGKLRRQMVFGAVASWASALLLLQPLSARAQTYPGRPIRIVVPFAPGGGNDAFARQLGARIAALLDAPVLVENRPGAGGTIGTEYVIKSPADGYTLLLGHTGTLAINPVLYPRLSSDPREALVSLGSFASAPLVLVAASSSSIRSLADLIARAKARPGTLTFASSGNGTGGHLAGKLLEQMAGIELIHVPYKGTAPALTEVIGGQVDLMFSVIPPALPHLTSAALRALAVTGVRRSGSLLQVPTVAEAGVANYESSLAYGLMAPRATPPTVVAVLSQAIARALQSAELRAALIAEGADPLPGSPEQFATLMRDESVKWGRVIAQAGIKPE